MRWASSLPRRLAVITAGLFTVSLVAALVSSGGTGAEQPPVAPNPTDAKPREVVPLFAKTEPAANPTELILLPDETGVRGWVAGAKSFAGSKVSLKVGNKDYEATVGDDNTFALPLTAAKPQQVAATLVLGGGKSLTTHHASAKPDGRTARRSSSPTAPRPPQAHLFVAYVHDTGCRLKPIANEEFTVDITSETQICGPAETAPTRRVA